MSGIRWFYLLVSAVAVAGGVLAVQRLLKWPRNIYTEAILAGCLVVIFISLLGFFAKLRE